MGLPTPEKTWQFAHIHPTPSGSIVGDVQNILFAMKNSLKAFGSQPWTVAGSNDGTTSGMDAVDRWDVATKITFDGTVGHSWIVLQAPSGWGGGQVLVYGANGGSFNVRVLMKWSLSGAFTGGTTTTIPTAVDEDTSTSGSAGNDLFNFTGNPTGMQCACHIMHSTDGQHTRVFFSSNNIPAAFWACETAGAAGPLWTPARFYGKGPLGNTTPLTTDNVWAIGQQWMRARSPNASLGAGSFGYLNAIRDIIQGVLVSSQWSVPNEINGLPPFYTLGLYGNPFYITGLRGQNGYIKDWWYSCNSINPGDGFPSGGAKNFMAFGTGIIVPWDGTTPVLG